MSEHRNQGATILVVEDDEALRFAVRRQLEREGYTVLTAARGDDGLKVARERRPDLIVLDVMLPGLDGMQFCRLLRRDQQTPIIMLTALGGESDRVAGLDMGADDYLAKPFSMRELLARIRALLRRTRSASRPAPAEQASERIVSGDLEALPLRREVRRNGEPLRLKPKEYDLLVFFMRHPGRVFTREQLLQDVWGYDYEGGERTVDVHVRWLRQKIEPEPSAPRRIKTVRGSGYLFDG
ncbi:Alkaline phosphatase synthesis transcriptional regulatory protein PhoP [bacterium HR29]|jgi:DNA-binding response OmpR family regulator|nr:Alkaline phosphatase synthesis transcriptional regulatory protein PhoP [bacterium HR29]